MEHLTWKLERTTGRLYDIVVFMRQEFTLMTSTNPEKKQEILELLLSSLCPCFIRAFPQRPKPTPKKVDPKPVS